MSRAPTIPPNRRSAGTRAIRATEARASDPYHKRSMKRRSAIRALLRLRQSAAGAIGLLGGITHVTGLNRHQVAVSDMNPRERLRDEKAVPALETPAAA